jgi:hypothetical protein
MGMTQPTDSHAAQGVEVFVALRIPQPRTITLGEGDGQWCVVLHQMVSHSFCILIKTKRQSPYWMDRREKPPILDPSLQLGK